VAKAAFYCISHYYYCSAYFVPNVVDPLSVVKIYCIGEMYLFESESTGFILFCLLMLPLNIRNKKMPNKLEKVLCLLHQGHAPY